MKDPTRPTRERIGRAIRPPGFLLPMALHGAVVAAVIGGLYALIGDLAIACVVCGVIAVTILGVFPPPSD